MKTISYNPLKDEMVIQFHPSEGEPTIEFDNFKIWGDKGGSICTMEITSFTKEMEEFEKKRNTINLQGIWKGIEITDKDIKEARKELVQILEGRW